MNITASFGGALVAASVMASAAKSQGCPDFRLPAESVLSYTADDLWVEVVRPVSAGGAIDLSNCPDFAAQGHVAQRPDVSLELTRNANGRMIRFTADAPASCDIVLLINAPSRAWLFTDDGDAQGSLLAVQRAATGRYDIWVGTSDGTTCPGARLRIESF